MKEAIRIFLIIFARVSVTFLCSLIILAEDIEARKLFTGKQKTPQAMRVFNVVVDSSLFKGLK